ncbi:MFS transporter [Dactylosporangium sp. NPDC005555]|uniref:MFS transporter n=1 Tax=Dactylosporangium sp. NPDC005555 TaxID=3154889 RepID=UPI0033A66E88
MHAKPAAEPLAVDTATHTAHTSHAAPATTHHGDAEHGPRTSWVVLALTLAAQILVVLDISVVNTALPAIGRDLHLAGSDMQWVVTAYLMMSGGGLLFGGRIADLLSRKWVFLTGLAVFTIASIVSGTPIIRSRLITAGSNTA